MGRSGLPKERKTALQDARTVIHQALKADCNEAETRRRIERLFENLMGFDAFKHLSRERAVRGAGETEHVDFTIHLEDEGEDRQPHVMVEIKRVAIDLALKHLKQVASYAIDAGCEWALLTNSREWQLYHVSFGKPPETRLVKKWDVLNDELVELDQAFDLISLRSLRKGALEELWQKTNVLRPSSLLGALLSEDALNAVRRNLRKANGVLLPPEDIVSGIRRLLNESALASLNDIRISIPEKKVRKPRRSKATDTTCETVEEATAPVQVEAPPIQIVAKDASAQAG